MSFDTQTRNRLAAFVGKCRKLLCGDFKTPGGEMARLLAHYGIQDTGDCFPVDTLTHLDEPGRETARTLRAILEHKQSTAPAAKIWKKFDPAVYDLIQEQGFTVLNRLCALRMAEERQLVFPCVSKGLQSDGFQLYEYHSGKANTEITPEVRYEHFLFSLFDELSLDLGALFDRFSPQGLLFPNSKALAELLEELNHPELAALWGQDETIGWIYQYWNSQEERKAMRDASAAPRNSRELAVRNQFFTPRYVVQFLSENTLGRTWYEMTQGNTALKDNCTYLVRRPSEVFLSEGEEVPEQASTDSEQLSQAEQLKQPVHIPFRPLKDPREIRLLDPACGSMHFGLYAFDLFETIYSEAWDLNVAKLREDFPTKEALLLEMPRLIIEHNIHGVDIDPRATQIAGLALWLRAQRTWKNQKVSATERPKVKRSNIVCAEPMPGDQDQLAEFTAKLHPAIAQMVAHIFEQMQLAGEAGSLLKIEEEITSLVDEAKEAWQKIGKREGEMFSAAEIVNADGRAGTQQILDTGDWNLSTLSSISHKDFFEKAESEIYAQLARYSETAGSGSYKRKLFANDAAHGFAFIDLCRKRYDAVVMNPPFGDSPEKVTQLLKSSYVNGRPDAYMCFVIRGYQLLINEGRLGAITSRTFLNLEFFGKMRELITSVRFPLELMLDLSSGVLDGATVETCAYTNIKNPINNSQNVTFFDLCNSSSKRECLIEILTELLATNDSERIYIRPLEWLSSLPNKILSYSLTDKAFEAFSQWEPLDCTSSMQKNDRSRLPKAYVKQGLIPGDLQRFTRLRYETNYQSLSLSEWIPICRGGEYHKFYFPEESVFRWFKEGAEPKMYAEGRYGSASRTIKNTQYFGKYGLTFPRISSIGFNVRLLPAGHAFSDAGLAVVTSSIEDAWMYLGLLNSRLCDYFARSLHPGRKFEIAHISSIPAPNDILGNKEISSKAKNCLTISRNLRCKSETDPYFTQPLWDNDRKSLSDELSSWKNSISLGLIDYAKELHQLNEAVYALYGMNRENAQEIDQVYYDLLDLPKKSIGDSGVYKLIRLAELIPEKITTAVTFEYAFENAPPVVDLLQYSFGTCFGRWDVRYAIGELQPPDFIDPFAPLPICPPGMLQSTEGLPATPADIPNDYPLRITWSGILVDDDGHSEDIVARVRDSLKAIWDDRAEGIDQESCDTLGVKQLRDYFAENKAGGKFFKDHLKRYSKSKRKAPIYWPLSTESGTYTLWFYYHRLSANTLYTAVTQFIEPKQEEAQATFAKLNAKTDRSKAEDKELEGAQLLVAELATFRESLLEIAKFWKPDLNDGVQITAAPLWKHFRLTAWRNTLKDTWSKLEHGDYDWAHLAHSIWPERVINKCITDRSLAIAHGHDEALWVEVTDAKGKSKWQTRQNAEAIAEELISQQTV